MAIEIKSVAIIGGGTLGSGIASLSASVGCEVLLLDVDQAAAERAFARTLATAQTPDEAGLLKTRITTGTIADDLPSPSQNGGTPGRSGLRSG